MYRAVLDISEIDNEWSKATRGGGGGAVRGPGDDLHEVQGEHYR